MKMEEFRFLKPEWLWACAAILPLYFILIWDERRRARQMETFANPRVWQAIMPGYDSSARKRKVLALCLTVFFAFLALARPQWGLKEEVVHTTGLDVMVLLDVSNSMETEDVTPSRLKKAKHLLSGFLDQMSGDRVGVVAFAESSFVAVPLTTDHGYVREVVDLLGPASVSAQGTNIGAALSLARKSLERGSEDLLFIAAKTVTTHAVLILSDGEDHEKRAQKEAQELAKVGVKVYSIGFGTAKGGPVPARDQNGNLLTYKKDDDGKTVVSVLKPDDLMSIAKATGGNYWTASAEESEIQELVRELSGLNRSDYAERRRLVYEERFQYPLAFSLIFLIWEMSISLTRSERKKAIDLTTSAGAALATMLLLTWLVNDAHAETTGVLKSWETYQDNEAGIKALERGDIDEAKRAFGSAQARDPKRPELEYNQGVVQMQEGNVEEAIRRFEGAAKGAFQNGHPDLGAEAIFNLGVAQAKKGDKKEALKSYLQALETAEEVRRRSGGSSSVKPETKLEADVRKNIELLLKQDQNKQQKQQQGQNQEQKDKDQKKQEQQGENKEKDQEKEREAKETGGQKRFKSEKLSSEDAERVMAELSNRERELKAKMGQQKGRQQSNGKDW
jgi:Ca-activated chloride channel family protein